MKILVTLLGLSILLLSCNKGIDVNNDCLDGCLELALPAQPNDQLAMAYDMITAQHAEARYPSDSSSLSITDKVFRAPEFTGAHVEMIVREDGTLDANIQMKQFPEMPVYPENRLNNTSLPPEQAIDRIEVRGPSVNCYNVAGEPIGSGIMQPEVLFITGAAENIKQSISFSQAEQDVIVQAFEGAGMNMEATNTEGVYLYSRTLPSGKQAKVVFDIKRGLQLGQASYTMDGKLDSKSTVYYEETADGQTVVAGHRFVTYMASPSSGVEMAIVRRSKVNNFQMQTK